MAETKQQPSAFRTLVYMILKRVVPLVSLTLVVKTLVDKPFLRRILVSIYHLLWERLTAGRDAIKDGFVLSQGDITPTWLEKTLKRKYPNVGVKSVSSKVMGDDMGNASLMFRLSIEYSNNDASLPKSMILKTPKDKAKARIPFAAARMLEMEARFFDQLEPSFADVDEIHIPKSFAARFNDEGNMFVLMEDLSLASKAQFRTEKDALRTLEELKQAARGIASFHGVFWDSPRLENDLSDIIQQTDPILGMTSEFMKAGWDSCVGRMKNSMPKDLKERGKLLVGIAQRLHDYAGGGRGGAPQTIVHGDCHLENAYIVSSANAKVGWELGLYDMQILRRGNGALDLASFFGGSVESGVFDKFEGDVLQAYLDRLAEMRDGSLNYRNSDTPYTLGQLKHDFRLCLGLLFCWNVAATLAVPFDSEAQLDYDLYMGRLCASLERFRIVDYCLAALGGKTLHTDKFRGDSPKWDVPPVSVVVPNNDLPHLDYGFKTYRANQRVLEPGLFNALKYRAKYEFMLTKTKSRGGHHGQKTTHLSPEFLENHHPVDYAKNTPVEHSAFDSYYLSSFAPFESSLPSFALRWCKRADNDNGENWLIIKVPGDSVYTWIDHPNTKCVVVYDGEDTIAVSSPDKSSTMRFECVEPMKKWRATFRGKLLRTKDKSIHSVSFDLVWTKSMPMFSFGTDVSPSLTAKALALETFTREWGDELKASHQEHYELFGETTGTLKIGWKTMEVKGQGMRDRAFGHRDWGYMQRYLSSYFWAGDKFYNITMASLPCLSNAKFGFVHSGSSEEKAVAIDEMSGEFEKICPDGVPAKELWLSFVSNDITYSMKMYIDEGDTIPLNMGPDGMLVNFRFAKYEVSYVDPKTGAVVRDVGYGANEMGYRFENANPKKPSLDNLKYLPVTGDKL